MEQKLGVYICTGCEIGNAVDIEKLEKHATKECKVPVCKSHNFLCGEEGVQLIKEDIKNEGVNRIVVAACSTRYHQTTFNFGEENIVARAPIREYVAWTQPHKEEDTQMAAEDYISMYTSNIKRQEIPVPVKIDGEKSLLVVGGGISGLTSALEAAKAGYKINLVEKEGALGGYALKLHQRFPSETPFRAIQPVDIQQKVKEVEENANISVYTSSTIDAISGQPGEFMVKVNQNGNVTEVRVGAVVMATGAKPYDASKLTHLGIEHDNVIASPEFEEMAASGKLTRKDGKEVKSVVFVQCAGSRDANHLSYCSSICCMTSLKQAAYVRKMNPEAKAYIIYKDMRTTGQYENFYKEQQADPGVFLTKGEIVGVREEGNKDVVVEADNTLLGEKIEIKADLVVLATGLETNAKDDPALNLQYRQGPGLPELKYGFPDSHFICFPYETRRTGVYTAGTVRHPMDMNFSEKDAKGAALKAIQAVELVSQGKAVSPRAGDLTFPDFALSRCTSCKRCTEECPFGVLDEDEKGTPKPNPARCRRCGTCMGACPERIINFANYSITSISEMVKNIEMPEEDDEKPRMLIFACENDALPAFDMLAMNRAKLNAYVRIIPLRCLGSANLVWVSDALSAGWDGVMFMGCKFGDDYQCHFVKGSELCNIRLSKVQETIGRLGLESERVEQFAISMNDYQKLPDIINEFVEKVEAYGPNPFKDM